MKYKKHIKLFEEYNEDFNDELLRVYHGDNYGTTSIKIENMDFDGNMQEGIGIYFTEHFNIAEQYGDHVVYADIDPDRFIESRDLVGDWLEHDDIKNILVDMWNIDLESMFYLISDYMEVHEPRDIEEYHIDSLAEYLKDEQCRNFQITLGQSFGVNNFAESWNLHIEDFDGTKNTKLAFYCIINTDINISPYIA